MGEFILILAVAAIFGVQLGIYGVLRTNGIPGKRAFLYSIILYILPFILIKSHVRLYKERHMLFEKAKIELKLDEKRYNFIKENLDGKLFFVIVIVEAIKDIFTPKDNIIVLTEFAVEYDKKFSSVKLLDSKTLFQKVGIYGVLIKSINLITDSMKDHAKEETFTSGMLIKTP